MAVTTPPPLSGAQLRELLERVRPELRDLFSRHRVETEKAEEATFEALVYIAASQRCTEPDRRLVQMLEHRFRRRPGAREGDPDPDRG